MVQESIRGPVLASEAITNLSFALYLQFLWFLHFIGNDLHKEGTSFRYAVVLDSAGRIKHQPFDPFSSLFFEISF
ncbi:hypothetical protein ANCCAN_04152 [Ancylostoma caninum]|uniref:Uncharacterized protein n=1 Tax=Ancylostoma caninum TaxID=29170 RepID=A0A368GZB8_ANCCA|nr:hypothetical protein ANCCAN_04152 [Ancylostoma caninum]